MLALSEGNDRSGHNTEPEISVLLDLQPSDAQRVSAAYLARAGLAPAPRAPAPSRKRRGASALARATHSRHPAG